MNGSFECPSCAWEVEGRPEACPYCGYEFPQRPVGFTTGAWVLALIMLIPVLWVLSRLL